MTREKRHWIELLSERIASRVAKKQGLDRKSFLKMKLGLETFLINVTKGAVVYGLSILLGTFLITLVTHLGFLMLRRYSYGLHAKSSVFCTATSILFFNVSPLLLRGLNLTISPLIFMGGGAVLLYLVHRYAPADTEKNPFASLEKISKLRHASVRMTALLLVASFFLPMYQPFIYLGLVCQVVMIHPLTYKILGRGYANYEKLIMGT